MSTKAASHLLTVLAAVGVMALVLGLLFPGLHATKSTCGENLKALQEVKIMWMREKQKPPSVTPTWADLKYLLDAMPDRDGWSNGMPVCPKGGVYTLGRVDEPPRCSIGGRGHSIHIHKPVG
jgi:hypothetical protein